MVECRVGDWSLLAAPTGDPIPGPEVAWTGRRHGRRWHRRWGRAWSPKEIARQLPLDYPDDPVTRISHEAIYQALYIAGSGGAEVRGVEA